ncbi:MAG: topoisomerase DNA-binding C4 zinc finger domain-containing protein [Planctomycetia bacterium]|nr:topoisomerase DNA-binding C4 zinc finger domain-containing protein [Planctomycetia bacterium]
MAKKTSKRATTRRGSTPKGSDSPRGSAVPKGDYQLVIVESPAKAKTIEKYLGPGFVVKASIGHIRDLPSKAPKGSRQPVPGVDIDHDFAPTYEIDGDKTKTVTELRRLAKAASDIWFATDLDREGEAIAWHLTQVLGVDPTYAKRVTFDAITKSEVQRAFQSPRAINMPRVEAQQARRIVDRIVGYQVSPILWKKVAGGLSAGRVQSVATRIVVDREQEIRAFTPAESWEISACMAFDVGGAAALHKEWTSFMARRDERGRPPLVRDRMAWLADHRSLACDLVEVGGKSFKIEAENTSTVDLSGSVQAAAEAAGLLDVAIARETDDSGKGRGRNVIRLTGRPDPKARYTVESIDVTRTRSKPYPPFITSTLQQAASSRLGMSTDRTMRIAQQLYEGIDLPDEGRVGLITYMRTDSTNLSREAVEMARGYLKKRLGDAYVPEKPRSYTSSNESAQEAHEAIRPTDASRDPDSIASALSDEQLKVYRLIWQCFVACQAADAEWDSTSVRMRRSDRDTGAVFKTNGRVLRFDGFYAISGTPKDDGEQVLPDFDKGTQLAPFDIEPRQKFQAAPPRYTEATLVKKMEEEGIGRPSTYASIINVIENRGYVVQQDRRFHATAIGEAVTGFLKRGFHDQFIEIGYTREIERELDQVAQGTKKWTDMLHEFHDELSPKLETALEEPHEKAKSEPSPYACPECGRRLEYRLGGKGEFLSCSGYNEKIIEEPPVPAKTAKGKKPKRVAKPKERPACTYAMPVDRQRRPLLPEQIDLLSPAGVPMVKRTGRFGDFLVEDKPRPVKPKGKKAKEAAAAEPPPFILNLDRKGNLKFPSPPPLVTDIACPKCGDLMNLRDGKRGPWLGCRAFPKCRGREAFTKLPEDRQTAFQKDLEQHLRGQTKLALTRRDGVTPVPEGTPLAQLTLPGGVAELQKFEG